MRLKAVWVRYYSISVDTNRILHMTGLRKLLRVIPVMVALLFVVATIPSSAQTNDEIDKLKAERERIQQEKASKATEVDASTAKVDDLTAVLETINQNVNSQQAELDDAVRQLETEKEKEKAASAAVKRMKAEIAKIEEELALSAVAAFVSNGSQSAPELIESSNANEALWIQEISKTVTGNEVDLSEKLRVREEDLQIEEAIAQVAAKKAENLKVEVETQLVKLEKERESQTTIVDEAELRLEAELAEAWALSELDKKLSDKISAETTKLQEELARQAAAAEKAAAQKASQNGSSEATPAPAAPAARGNYPGRDDIVNVRGIFVHKDVAESVDNMVAAAAADGVTLNGSGYRDNASQIRLRKAHCGTSQFAIYQMRASRCSPPTARPGSSQHEYGRAIDFKNCSSRGTACYRWLSQNASRFGFKNLPSEPWHWSPSGR